MLLHQLQSDQNSLSSARTPCRLIRNVLQNNKFDVRRPLSRPSGHCLVIEYFHLIIVWMQSLSGKWMLLDPDYGPQINELTRGQLNSLFQKTWTKT